VVKFSVIVVSYNSKSKIEMCLRSIRQAIDNYNDMVEIIVVDNGSSDGTYEMLEELKDRLIFMLFRNRNEGFGAGVNKGSTMSNGDIIVVLNPDVRVNSDFFSLLKDSFVENPDAGIVAPKLTNGDGSIQYSVRRYPSVFSVIGNRIPYLCKIRPIREHVQRYLMLDCAPAYPKFVQFALGACLAIRAEVFSKIGGFDRSYFLYYEDVQLCKDVWESGWKIVYCPQIQATHDHERSSLKIFSRAFYEHVRSALIFYCKNPGLAFSLPTDEGISG
jgi:N-acetylglucosaminyl-diphospho-decaprenol L-rhamnosyltransferase